MTMTNKQRRKRARFIHVRAKDTDNLTGRKGRIYVNANTGERVLARYKREI